MYFKLYSKIILPFYEKVIKKRKRLDYCVLVKQTQSLDRKQVLQYQWKELQKIIRHSYEQVPYWQEVFDKLNIGKEGITNYKDFQKLPIIEKYDIRANKSKMIARNYIGKTWTKSTGGSTGIPLELDYTADSYDWRVAVSKRGYSWAGCEDGIKQLYVWGVAIGNESWLKKIKKNIHHKILRHIYVNCFKFSKEEMEKTVKTIQRFKPKVIIGYTNPLYNFAKFINDKGIVGLNVKSVISAAEKLHEFQREEIKKAFNCEVFNTYGSREFMLIASECEKHKGLHINVENLFVEVIKEDGQPAKPGEMGDIVITDLHNYGMPFIRYRIGDMAVVSDRECGCGRGLPLLEDVVGRSLDMIKTPDGRLVPGEFFPHLMKEFKGIEKFQVVQDKVNELKFRIVKNNYFKDSEFDFMKKEIIKVIGEKMFIDFIFVDSIPLTKTGKFRVTISNLDKND